MPTHPRKTTNSPADAVQDAARDTTDNVPDAGEEALEAGRQTGSTAGELLRAPGTAIRTVVEDLTGAARRPDAVLTWLGLAGLAAFGVIEAPVAAAVGVGIAVAGGVRRARSN